MTDPDDDMKSFNPPKDWIRDILIIAQRYGTNYGARWGAGRTSSYVLEPVHRNRKYIWTTDGELQKRRETGQPIPKVTPLGPPIPDFDDNMMTGLANYYRRKKVLLAA